MGLLSDDKQRRFGDTSNDDPRREPMSAAGDVALRIADQLASCGVRLVASLPDNWISELIRTVDSDARFAHVPVNREESAVALCSGAYMGAMGSAALMGASGLMTVIYAITKINYTYEIPLFLLTTLRGAVGDHHKHHVSNGLYLLPVLDAISLPYVIVDRPDQIAMIGATYKHWRNYSRPSVVALTRNLLRGGAH
jgi:sulfopyruvate decarboxylase TPP-binding subunit